MNSAKCELEKYDVYRNTAHNILLEIGAIEECPHGNPIKIKIGGEKAYAMATNALKKKHPEFNDYKLFHEQIQTILDSAKFKACVVCEKLKND